MLPTLNTFPNRGPILSTLFAFVSPTLKLFPNNAIKRPRRFLRYRINLLLRSIELVSRLAQLLILSITYDLTSVLRIDHASLLYISIIYFHKGRDPINIRVILTFTTNEDSKTVKVRPQEQFK